MQKDSKLKWINCWRLVRKPIVRKINWHWPTSVRLKCLRKCIAKSFSYHSKCTASPAALRAFAMGAVTMYMYGYCGSVVLLTYGANIFRDTGSDFDPNISTIIMGSVQLLGTMSAIVLIDKFGRKTVYIMSTAGAMIGLACVGTYTYLANNGYALDGLSWVPVVTISIALYATCIGIVPVSIVLMAELLPGKVGVT